MTFDAVKDSGQRRSFSTGSVRDARTGKGRYDLIPPLMLQRLAKHYENGATKYGDHNWTLGQHVANYFDSAMRHIILAQQGYEDEDHLAAAIWNLTSIMWTLDQIRQGKLDASLDDRHWKEERSVSTTEEAVQDHPDAAKVGVPDEQTVPLHAHP